MHARSILIILVLAACGEKDDTASTRVEGQYPGECSDGADNDADGLYDCNDPDCAGAPDCEADTDTDTDADTDTDTDADADADADADTGIMDDDGDGYSESEGDCDDADDGVHPDAVEVLDGADNDCDGSVDYLSLIGAGAKLVGEAAADRAGFSVASAGDVNNDGYDDVLVAASEESSEGFLRGAAYIVHGPISGEVSLNSAAAKMLGEANEDSVRFVAGAGDLNGDGYADVMVGAPSKDFDEVDVGKAYILFGPVSGEVNLSYADASIAGEAAHDNAGSSYASLGDVDSDGFGDFCLGAWGHSTEAGRAGAIYCMSGPLDGVVSLSGDATKITGESGDDFLGASMDSADFSGDGLVDVVVGSHLEDSAADNAGAVYLLHSPVLSGSSLADARAKVMGEDADDKAGEAVAAAGDVNGDGHEDLLVGAYGVASQGTSSEAAYLVLGPFSGESSLAAAAAMYSGLAAYDYAGGSVAGPGDVDGDGRDDLLVGASGNDDGGAAAGATYLILGPATGSIDLSDADAVLKGEQPSDAAGSAVAGAGDVDGDGHPDFIVGARFENSGGGNAGAAYLLYGGEW